MTTRGSKAKPDLQVEIKGLFAGYNSEAVIRNVFLKIYQGDFIGLIGPNGGGKTTLLKTILGLLEPQQGGLRVMGKTAQSGRRHIGYVPQFSVFDTDFPISVKEVVRMGRLTSDRLFKPFNREDDRVVKEKLAWVEMLDHQNRAWACSLAASDSGCILHGP